MSDSGEPKSGVSRRDFLKIMKVGGVAALAVGARVEISSDPHFVNALKVTKELTEAQISKDPSRIYESRKLAMVWLFAETAIRYSEEMDLGKAGMTMEHYLYGEGKPLDISFVFEKIAEMSPESFVGNLISSAINNSQNNTVKNKTTNTDYMFTKRALRDLKSEEGLDTALDAESIITWRELRYAFGGAKYELHAPEAYIESVEHYGQRIVLEKGVEIIITDRYDWEKNFQIFLPNKASEVAEHTLKPVIGKFYESNDFVEKTIKALGISESDSIKIMEIYSSESRLRTESAIATSVYDFVSETNTSLIGQPDLMENDLNLLKKIGAADYEMKGYVNLPIRLEFSV